MINLGQINFDDNSTVGEPLVLRQTNGINAIGTATGAGPKLKAYTVATLPAATADLAGTIAYVSDATAPELGVALVGGDVVFCLALCTGAAWVAV